VQNILLHSTESAYYVYATDTTERQRRESQLKGRGQRRALGMTPKANVKYEIYFNFCDANERQKYVPHCKRMLVANMRQDPQL